MLLYLLFSVFCIIIGCCMTVAFCWTWQIDPVYWRRAFTHCTSASCWQCLYCKTVQLCYENRSFVV